MSSTHQRAYISAEDEQRACWSLGGLFKIRAAGTDTGGGLALSEAVMTRLAEPPLDVHHGEDEAWYVIEGKLTFEVGGKMLEAGPNSFVFAPRDVAHRFTVDVEPTRVLVITSPGGGFEGLVEESGIPVSASRGPLPPDVPKLMQLADRYRFEILGPPLRAAH